MIFSTKKKVLSAVLSLAMIGTMFASVPFSASAADATTTTTTTAAKDIGVSYSTQVQTYGWQTAVVDGALAGTVGKAKRLEAIKISLTGADLPTGAKITYQTQVQTYGWQTAVSDGALAGTVGKAKRLEAIKITLSGMPGYSVKYQVQGQTYGWQDAVTTENGTAIADATLAGTVGKAKRLEAIKITIVKDATPVVDDSNLKVSSATATSASTVAVTFNQAPSDTSKIAATVKLNSTATTVTSTWNSDNTILTLTKASKFASGSYTVDVLNSTTDLGSNTVTFADQKVGKIDITSNALAYTYKTASGTTTYYGFVTYKVYDQYGVDVTSTTLGNNIVISSIGTNATHKNGIYEIQSVTTPFSTYGSVVINAYDSSTGVNVSKTLTIATTTGTLSSFTLGTALQDADGNATTLITGSSSNVAYLPYTATDVNGNPTTDYNYISSGLIDTDTVTSGIQLSSSSSTYVVATLVQDPNDSTKAAIQLSAGTAVTVDTPITINAMTSSGANSSFSFTLKKLATVTTFALSAPDSTVIAGSAVSIPFTAEDQNGNVITDYSTLHTAITSSVVSLSPNDTTQFSLVSGSDGKGYLYFTEPTASALTATTVYLSASTTAGKYSSISFTVEPSTAPDTFTMVSTKYVKAMAASSTQELSSSAFSILDKYDSAYSITAYNSAYAVYAFSNDSSIGITDNNGGTNNYIYGDNKIELTATAADTAASSTITFVLALNNATNKAMTAAQLVADTAGTDGYVDTQTVTFTKVISTSITSYGIDAIGNLYAASVASYGALGATSALTSGMRYAYATNTTASVYGLTTSGTRVLLPATDVSTGKPVIAGVTASNSDFTAYSDKDFESATSAKAIVFGNAYTTTGQTTSTGTLTGIINGLDGNIYKVQTALTSSSATPVATSVDVSVDVGTAGSSYNSTTGAVTLTATSLTSNPAVVHVLNTPTVINGVQWGALYFNSTDQYGWACSPVTVYVGSSTPATGSSAIVGFDSATGCLTKAGGADITDYTLYKGTVTLTASAANGLTKTIILTID